MSDAPTMRFSGEEILALKFAAHRQLARWSKNPRLSTDQRAQRKGAQASSASCKTRRWLMAALRV